MTHKLQAQIEALIKEKKKEIPKWAGYREVYELRAQINELENLLEGSNDHRHTN